MKVMLVQLIFLEKVLKEDFVETVSRLLPGLKLEMLVSNKFCVCLCV